MSSKPVKLSDYNYLLGDEITVAGIVATVAFIGYLNTDFKGVIVAGMLYKDANGLPQTFWTQIELVDQLSSRKKSVLLKIENFKKGKL